ncbi:MAG TPA: phosphoribosylanthranilate isomerase [Saprospiraceae bacterium]|nr:phosphoribosylanthranilate isomerase [Saprospiraceae bacterium]HPN68604.1 phosphoribosylanthranilate isomerase [Saprospiraceae bacterium]
MEIKVCGLKVEDNIRQVIDLGVDYIGLNFYKPSPRYVEPDVTFAAFIKTLTVQKVGVFVNESIQTIKEISQLFGLDYIQLHGHENDAFIEECLTVGKVIQVVGVNGPEDLEDLKINEGVSYLLFDKKSPLYGGTGIKFDWNWLELYNGQKPFLLAGGIGPDDIDSIQNIDHELFIGLDLNSKFESEPGIKDVQLLDPFLKKLFKEQI